VDEMLDALVGARRWYGEWFAPYPWKTLRLSEFAGWPTYAQAPPGNITFSENIGFLTRSRPDANAAFWIAAHESAHMWWPNIAMTAEGPGTEVLSEGMAHFSTILLTGEMRGEHERIELCKRFEERYGDGRVVDSEKPMTELVGSRPGDTVVLYEKGGWAAWMMLQLIGRENMLRGCQQFIRKYEHGPDHPVLQDFVAELREFALDKPAYDAFVDQWYFHVLVPEYKLEDVTRTPLTEGGGFELKCTVHNTGTGTMPIELAASRGERFPDEKLDAKKKEAPSDSSVVAAAEPKPKNAPEPYRDARASVTLAAGESKEVVIRCDFEPQLVTVDPDAKVLQLRRKYALFKF